MDKVELDAITERIIGAAHKVSNTLGAGFVEKVYENAHAHEMRKDGLLVVQQHAAYQFWNAQSANPPSSPISDLENTNLEICETMKSLSKESYSSPPFIPGE
jgi:hypothetical protein